MTRNREVVLKRRPTGIPQESDFEMVDRELRPPGPGQVLVRNLFVSVDPYQRNRMRSALRPGEAVPARCIGEVVASNEDNLRPVDPVFVGSWLTGEASIDAAINYRKVGDLTAEMRRCCPGIDLLFETVGGPQLDAAAWFRGGNEGKMLVRLGQSREG